MRNPSRDRMASFLTPDQSRAVFAKRGFDKDGFIPGSRAATRMKCSAFTYESRIRNGEQVADAVARHFGDASRRVGWACAVEFGPGTDENARSPDWRAFEAWRSKRGAEGPLEGSPGHAFERGDGVAFREFVLFALYLGWDTLLLSDANRTIVRLSHDDRIELYGFAAPAELIAALSALCKPAPWFDPRRGRR